MEMFSLLSLAFLCFTLPVGWTDEVIPYQCSLKESCRWSTWTKCVAPTKNLTDDVRELLDSLEQQGCASQSPMLQQLVLRIVNMYSKQFLPPPIHRRLFNIKRECGMCALKLRCCKNAPSFLAQSFDGESCSSDAAPSACNVEPLSITELYEYQTANPGWRYSDIDVCNFNQLFVSEVDKLDTTTVGGRVLCSLFGRPRLPFNCKRVGSQCQCCCNRFKPDGNGGCYLDSTQAMQESVCSRDESEGDCLQSLQQRAA